MISEDLCKILNKDPFTIVLSIWAAFQLTWVTMLLCVQLLQVARNLTTYESMRGHLHSNTPADALNSFVTTGDTSQDVAGNSSATNGFGSGQDTGDAPRPQQPKQDNDNRGATHGVAASSRIAKISSVMVVPYLDEGRAVMPG
jgi:hypothetical protein